MTNPFEGHEDGPQAGGVGFNPLDPQSRRAMHHARREAKREFREQLKDQVRANAAAGWGAGFGPGFGGGFGPGFGPGGFGFGPGGRGGPRGHRGRGRGRGRRGDTRAAILALLTERPMHGYEMIQQIADRSNGLWRPSPGSIYPTLQLLVDEGLIVATEADGSKRLFELTDAGREATATAQTPPWEEIADDADPDEVNLRAAAGQLAAAVFQSSHAATADQHKRIVDIINKARKEIYGVLGEDD
jgi:DNA-binding PadR family transcriptional regulator